MQLQLLKDRVHPVQWQMPMVVSEQGIEEEGDL